AVRAARRVEGPLSSHFGLIQFELPGGLELPDGRYLARDESGERVLVIETVGAPPPPRRRRRKPQTSEPGAEPAPLPLARVTAVRAHEPFESGEQAERWLAGTLEDEESTDAAIAEALALINRTLHANAVAAADPLGREVSAEHAATVRIGHGSGKQVAAGRYEQAREIDVRGGRSQRRRREEDLRPQERVAAILGGREQLDACETLLLRARTDLDAARNREAALQLRVGLEALLVELDGALADSGHAEDMATLKSRRGEVGEAANEALRGELNSTNLNSVRELLDICERVLRRRRVLRG
ncbi:MAG TPA: hypothetical protein VFS26_01695, partial [Solirubrobacterales bacterium]|nr:hypothetical protein [Solirubrobacterales bacterium]